MNVLAFLFVGLQARAIVLTLDAAGLHHAMRFAALVFATVVGVRIVWVMLYNRIVQPLYRWLGYGAGPSWKQGIVASWCGMRGMVTLAAALALPETFPQRGLVVLSARAVVLGTLIVQSITLGSLIRLLSFPVDTTHRDELARARPALATIAEDGFAKAGDASATLLREELRIEQPRCKVCLGSRRTRSMHCASPRSRRNVPRSGACCVTTSSTTKPMRCSNANWISANSPRRGANRSI